MKLVVGLGSIDDYIRYCEAGADECFIGYVPEVWMEKYPDTPLNRREVRYYNVQIGSMSDLLILRDMIRDTGVPVTIAMNALGFTPEERTTIAQIIKQCSSNGFNKYIIADGNLVEDLQKTLIDSGDFSCDLSNSLSDKQKSDLHIHLSGEYGELNHLILEKIQSHGVKRIIFPRQTTLEEMEAMILQFPDFEYEAFLFNERCQFTGAYCNSVHCDELCHACRIPYKLVGAEEYTSEECYAEDRTSQEHNAEDHSTGAHNAEDLLENISSYIPGESGCGLCKLWQLQRIGITHLKLVSRGNDTESTLRDIQAIRKAMEILEETNSKSMEILEETNSKSIKILEETNSRSIKILEDSNKKHYSEKLYISSMKEGIFPKGCSGNCYF